MPRKIRSIAITVVAVLALSASAFAATNGIVNRSAARTTVVAPVKHKTVRTVKVITNHGVTKTIVTISRGATVTKTVTYLKNGKKYVITVVTVHGKVVTHTVKVSKAHTK